MQAPNGDATAANGGDRIQVAEASNENHVTRHGSFVHYSSTTIDLIELTKDAANPRYEVFLAGFVAGRDSLAGRIRRLEYEADLWYFCHTNGKTPADFYRHETNRLWEQGVSA